jgi:hypothetical protein
MISCSARARLREQTLRNLAVTDWADRPVLVQLDEGRFANARERQAHTAYLALRRCAGSKADYLLFLEDDLEFNRFLWTNLHRWQPLLERRVTLAGLYNPGLRTFACDVEKNARIVAPDVVFGSQALLLSRATIRHVLQHWETVGGMQDIRISRLAGQLQNPIYYHAPSLVQHVGRDSLWGGYFHQAIDFAPNWKAPGL